MENENTINEMYNKFLDMADSVKDGNPDEESMKQFESLKQEFNELDKSIESEVPTTESTVMVSYNPLNGEQMVVDDNIDTKAISNKQFDSFLDNGNINSIEKILNSKELKDLQDATKIASIIQRRLNGETFNYYEELPESMKKEVMKIYVDISTQTNNKQQQFSKNTIARMFIDDMVESYKKESQKDSELDLDTLLAGFDKDIEDIRKEFSTELGTIMMSFDEERKAQIDAGIKRCEESGNEEAANNLRKIRDTLDSAYYLDDFAEFCSHCKIKKYDLEKPNRIYDHFNYKYINHKNDINDIRTCPDILDRHLLDFTHQHKVMLCLAFCKYCQNMSPDNIEEHTFMYYFIRNIIAIDRINPKGLAYNILDERSKKFYNEYTASLTKCISNLLERNTTLK